MQPCSVVQDILQGSIVQWSAVQCSAVPCSTVQGSEVQYSAGQCSAMQCRVVSKVKLCHDRVGTSNCHTVAGMLIITPPHSTALQQKRHCTAPYNNRRDKSPSVYSRVDTALCCKLCPEQCTSLLKLHSV